MKPLSVLRIETKEGIGMFMNTVNDAYDIIPNACNRHFTHPEDCTEEPFPKPQKEGLDIYLDNKEWVCAFLSLEQLNSLIYPDEIRKLLDVGYNVLLLTIDEYQKGEHQVLYTIESVSAERNLNSLFL